MSRQQFRILVVVEQLLAFSTILVQGITDNALPPELKDYLGITESVLFVQNSDVYSFDDAPYLIGRGLCLSGATNSRQWIHTRQRSSSMR